MSFINNDGWEKWELCRVEGVVGNNEKELQKMTKERGRQQQKRVVDDDISRRGECGGGQ